MNAILVIVGPSGVGKTTVANRVVERDPSFEFVRSATTRAPRGDGNDSEYLYLTREEFLGRVDSGQMLEYMEYGGNLYGTPASEVERIHSEGKTPLLVLDIEGAKSLRRGNFDFRSVILYVYEDLATINGRLSARTGATPESVARRCELNKRDYLSMPEISHLFDDFLRNDVVDEAASEVMAIFEAVCGGAARPDAKIADISAKLYNSAK